MPRAARSTASCAPTAPTAGSSIPTPTSAGGSRRPTGRLLFTIAPLPVRDIAPWLRHDGAPPLYYYLLHGWIKVFGTSDLAVRSLSGVFGVAAIPLAWMCGKRTGDRTTAWITVVV